MRLVQSFLATAVGLGLALVLPASAQTPPSASDSIDPAPDSTDPVEDVRERQAAFESFRRSRIPVRADFSGGACDERIGRICIWFGGEGETSFPPEPPETETARDELIVELASALDAVKDPWIAGQLVHYMVEAGYMEQAEQVARDCGLAEVWWCRALLGYVLHVDGRFVEAEGAFREAVSSVPPEEADRWRTPRFVLTQDQEARLREMDPEERDRVAGRFWRFSDPLFMVEGNDRLTEHYARLVVARNREAAVNPYEMIWGEDLEESLVRYGRQIGWSRVTGYPVGLAAAADPRRIVGHHDPMSRGYLFPETFLEAPADIPPESWITAPRAARAWYAPPYAPDFRGLDTQVARFRRGEEMLVVAAYRPTPPERDPFAGAADPPAPESRNPFARSSGFGEPDPPPDPEPEAEGEIQLEGPLRAAFFLMPEAGGEAASVEGEEQEGVLSLRAPAGRYVGSMEVLETETERAWRARQGVNQQPMVRGLVALSDLLILREDAPLPADLDEAIPLARPGIRVRSDERFTVAWEVYGLGVNQEVQVTLGFTTGRPGFLARVGEFLGIIEPEQPVEVTFSDAGGDEVQTLFRAVALELPDLAPGEYTLHLRLDLPGREPSISSRPIIVTP